MNKKINELLDNQSINGGVYWSRHDGNIYAPNGFSTMDILNVLGDFGFTCSNKSIKSAVEYIFELYDQKTRLFKYSEKSSKLPCVNARLISILKKLEAVDKRIDECMDNLLNMQEVDGGWRCATVKKGKAPETDASNPGTTLYVLDAFRYYKTKVNNLNEINKAIIFLLKHWETKAPLGPCAFGIGSTFMKTEYPFVRYNLFYYIYVLSFYEIALKDKRFKEALLKLKEKESNNEITIENPNKNWKKILFNKNNTCLAANKKYEEILLNVKKT